MHTTKCKGSLYIITNSKNDKKYIGITTNTIKYRLNHHFYKAEAGSKTKLAKAIRRLGKENFTIELLRKVNNKKDLRNLEIKYIKKYNTIKEGYNSVVGGCCLGHKVGHIIEYKGLEFISIKQLANHLNIPYHTVRYRLQKGEYKNAA